MQTDPSPDSETYGSCVTPKLVKWKGDWSKFKKLFRAAAARDGVTEALATGERIAKWSTNNMTEGTEPQKVSDKAKKQSSKLSDLLILTLGETNGIQQSIVMEKAGDVGNGIEMWAKLISHFEHRATHLSITKLLNEWENETLKTDEHPDELYTRLSTKKTMLLKLGEIVMEIKLTHKGSRTLKTPALFVCSPLRRKDCND
eukprot:152405_1